MTDENVEQIQSGLESEVAEVETTPKEGAAEQSVPEGTEQATTEEMDKEQELRKTLSFFQGKYQHMVEALKQYDPAFLASIKEQPPGAQEEQVVTPPVAPPPDGEGTDEYADPGLRRLEKRLDHVTELLTNQAEQQQVKDKYTEEWNASDQILSDFLVSNKVPQELVQRARAIVGEIPGIDVRKPGGPAAYAKSMGAVLTGLFELQRPGTPATPTEKVLAERQAREVALAAQPGGSPSPMGQPPKEESEKAADDIAPDFNTAGSFGGG